MLYAFRIDKEANGNTYAGYFLSFGIGRYITAFLNCATFSGIL